MFKRIKERLYFLKQWYVQVFCYPRENLILEESLDYDAYWKEKLSSGRTEGLSRYEQKRADIVLLFLQNENEAEITVGDIACGPGTILAYLASKHRVLHGICYDVSTYALTLAKEKGLETINLDINVKKEVGKIIESDYFLLLEVLEHIPHSERLLNMVYLKARKGVFFSFPNSGYFSYRLRLLFGKMPAQWRTFPNEHLRFWTLTDLRWWLKALGYQHYKIVPYQGVPILNRIFPSLFSVGVLVYLSKSDSIL